VPHAVTLAALVLAEVAALGAVAGQVADDAVVAKRGRLGEEFLDVVAAGAGVGGESAQLVDEGRVGRALFRESAAGEGEADGGAVG
jgi:hypothetical protein